MATRIKVKRILELLEKDLSANEIAKTYSISKHLIHAVRARASELGISYGNAKEQSEEELYELFFPDRVCSQNIYLLPDYEYVHKELRKVGIRSSARTMGNSQGQETSQITSSTSPETGSKWTGLVRR